MTEHKPDHCPGTGPADNRKPGWQQLNITFASPHRHAVEHAALTHLGPAITDAETQGLITSWFFIRKHPWKLRYLPADPGTSQESDTLLHTAAANMHRAQHATAWCRGIYEPETHAFGGGAGMAAAHILFHADSRHIFAYLPRLAGNRPIASDTCDQRRELSILLCTALMRAAGQDRYEQGDTWAKLCHFRPNSNVPAERQDAFNTAVERLITTDTGPDKPLRRNGLHHAHEWFTAFEHTGKTLRTLADNGQLTRGLRAVATHHIIFHWNRIGLPPQTQANIAHAATQIIFGR
jgi:thiopeptide-type bacteriocin biosynthesis protein